MEGRFGIRLAGQVTVVLGENKWEESVGTLEQAQDSYLTSKLIGLCILHKGS